MKISQQGLEKIVQREGVILHAYRDSVGVWTIGTGHTTAAGPPEVHPGMVITKEQNDEILRQDLKPIEEQFVQYVHVDVTQNQYDAIISIVFNVGPKFWHSTAVQRLNSHDVEGAAEAILMWNKPPEIKGRRHTEYVQFLTPDSISTGTTVSIPTPAPTPTPTIPSGPELDQEVNTWTHIFNTLKQFFKDNFATNILIAGSASASFFTHYWPYILAGAVVVSGLAWLGFEIYEKYKWQQPTN